MGLNFSAQGEFPRSVIQHPAAGYMLNGTVNKGSLPDFVVGADGSQLYVLVAPSEPTSPNIAAAQIILFSFAGGFRRLDTSAIMHHGFDANKVLIDVDLSFEAIDPADGSAHTCKLFGSYTSGDSMPYQIVEQPA